MMYLLLLLLLAAATATHVMPDGFQQPSGPEPVITFPFDESEGKVYKLYVNDYLNLIFQAESKFNFGQPISMSDVIRQYFIENRDKRILPQEYTSASTLIDDAEQELYSSSERDDEDSSFENLAKTFSDFVFGTSEFIAEKICQQIAEFQIAEDEGAQPETFLEEKCPKVLRFFKAMAALSDTTAVSFASPVTLYDYGFGDRCPFVSNDLQHVMIQQTSDGHWTVTNLHELQNDARHILEALLKTKTAPNSTQRKRDFQISCGDYKARFISGKVPDVEAVKDESTEDEIRKFDYLVTEVGVPEFFNNWYKCLYGQFQVGLSATRRWGHIVDLYETVTISDPCEECPLPEADSDDVGCDEGDDESVANAEERDLSVAANDQQNDDSSDDSTEDNDENAEEQNDLGAEGRDDSAEETGDDSDEVSPNVLRYTTGGLTMQDGVSGAFGVLWETMSGFVGETDKERVSKNAERETMNEERETMNEEREAMNAERETMNEKWEAINEEREAMNVAEREAMANTNGDMVSDDDDIEDSSLVAESISDYEIGNANDEGCVSEDTCELEAESEHQGSHVAETSILDKLKNAFSMGGNGGFLAKVEPIRLHVFHF